VQCPTRRGFKGFGGLVRAETPHVAPGTIVASPGRDFPGRGEDSEVTRDSASAWNNHPVHISLVTHKMSYCHLCSGAQVQFPCVMSSTNDCIRSSSHCEPGDSISTVKHFSLNHYSYPTEISRALDRISGRFRCHTSVESCRKISGRSRYVEGRAA
jgi:hypothetical protein